MNKKGFALGLILIVGVIIILGIIIYLNSQQVNTITIKEKWVKYHNTDAKYLVSSTNNDVYEITDSIIMWRWDSSNLYSYIENGKTCQIKTIGWRFPFFSWYKNILEANCK